jgi:hypothetical protein
MFITQTPHCQNTKYKIRTIAFYNVENLFDTINNPETFDDDFTVDGKNNYSSKIYWDRIDKISKVISQIGFDKTNTSPAIIGVAEIENGAVLEDLIHSNNLKSKNYQIIHFDSPDIRGIDVALLYQEKYFSPVNQEKFEIKLWEETGKRLYTRDILLVSGILDDELIHILVNHWPSRRGGQTKSSHKRAKAAYVTQEIIESIRFENENAKIFIMGDFNDDPIDKSLKKGLISTGKYQSLNQDSLYNPMEKMFNQGLNSLGYRDGLNLFDQILLSNACITTNKDYSSFKFYKAGIFNPSFLIAQKGRYKGYPLRSFQNNTYSGGYSDHFPVYVYVIKKD